MIGTLTGISSIVDTDLACRRHRLAVRLAAAKQSLAEGQREASERRAAFWQGVEARRAADAAVARARAKV